MKKTISWSCVGAVVAFGCAGEAVHEAAPVSMNAAGVDARAIGVDTIAITETADTVAIVGLAGDGTELAQLALFTGRFVLTDADLGTESEVDGRRMHVSFLGEEATHESEGRDRLELPLPREPRIGTFLRDPAVTAALSRAGVGLESTDPISEPMEAADEVGYVDCAPGGDNWLNSPATGCDACTFNGCTASSCKQFPLQGYVGEYRCCPGSSTFNQRRCAAPKTQTNCGLTGNGGCAVCWTETYDLVCTVTDMGSYCRAHWCSAE